ncbi:hypothetical protein BGZ76_002532 [Entomortierella beljakovae]|nr:hypothetical protein BGZ76_002532 [Entomortierella beljakovae]
MFTDVFSTLFNQLLSHLDHKTIPETTIWAVVRNDFVSLKDHLISLNYPNFSNSTKLKLVVDEAQILGDQGDGLYASSSSDSESRPVLSPILHGFRDPAERSELTVIYCGTGLSIRTLHWALCSMISLEMFSPLLRSVRIVQAAKAITS